MGEAQSVQTFEIAQLENNVTSSNQNDGVPREVEMGSIQVEVAGKDLSLDNLQNEANFENKRVAEHLHGIDVGPPILNTEIEQDKTMPSEVPNEGFQQEKDGSVTEVVESTVTSSQYIVSVNDVPIDATVSTEAMKDAAD